MLPAGARAGNSMARDEQQIDATIDIVTPENIAFQYQLAGPFRRLPAFLIDAALRLGVWMVAVFVLGIAGIAGGGAGIALLFLLWFVLEWFYGGLLETFWNGQTVGKRMLGIRVLSTDGQPINGLQAVMRNILRYVDMMPLIPLTAWGLPAGPYAIPTFMVGLLTPMFTQRFQRLGDVVCGTIVVIEQRGWLLGVPQLDDPRALALSNLVPPNFQAPRTMARALAAYVERRQHFSPARRQEIARHLGAPLRVRFQLPADTSCDLLLCALYHRTFVADQAGDSLTRIMHQPNE